MLDRLIEAYRFVDEHGSFTDDPVQRLRDLLLKFLRDPTLPIVVLGGLASEAINLFAGRGDPHVVGAFVVAELVALGLYVVGDEVAEAIEAAEKTYTARVATGSNE